MAGVMTRLRNLGPPLLFGLASWPPGRSSASVSASRVSCCRRRPPSLRRFPRISRCLPPISCRRCCARSSPGWIIGCGSGLLAAVALDRSHFLRAGVLPLGALVSAMPIVGVAPIMVMWFGFDWQSKAAVVVIMTFFPMLVNATAGLAEAGVMERDLMRSYGAGYWQTFFQLRLPAAMPFVFNALKLNATLALIGAIVAEFFGTPIVGMGFRISTEVARMNLDVVWAEIVLAALSGGAAFALLGLAERAVTFWHPSFRN